MTTELTPREATEMLEEIVLLQESVAATEKRVKELKGQLRKFMEDNNLKDWHDGEKDIIAEFKERATANGHGYSLEKLKPDTLLRAWQANLLNLDHATFTSMRKKKDNDSGWMAEIDAIHSDPGTTEYFSVKRVK
jgi:hypothetical protein